MKMTLSTLAAISVCGLFLAGNTSGQDWPQWRGVNRDAKTTGFVSPKEWPKELTRKWQVNVGQGDATPALAGGKLFVFARDNQGEAVICLEAANGKEIWRKNYATAAAQVPMGEHSGPRSSPTVTNGKIIVYGARGALTCFDAANGSIVWQKDELPGVWPRFFTASSPLVTEDLCLAQLGSEDKGGLFAYDLAKGDLKWKWTDEGTSYASPELITVDGTKMVVFLTPKRLVAVVLADGKFLWDAPFPARERAYNSATPVVSGSTVICSGVGRGLKAWQVAKNGDSFAAKEIWTNPDATVQFNTPVLKADRIYGISQKGDLFCVNAKDGKTLWSNPIEARDFGSVVDLGDVLITLSAKGELSVFDGKAAECKKLATYKVTENRTYSYPVIAGRNIYVKDKEALTLWTLE